MLVTRRCELSWLKWKMRLPRSWSKLLPTRRSRRALRSNQPRPRMRPPTRIGLSRMSWCASNHRRNDRQEPFLLVCAVCSFGDGATERSGDFSAIDEPHRTDKHQIGSLTKGSFERHSVPGCPLLPRYLRYLPGPNRAVQNCPHPTSRSEGGYERLGKDPRPRVGAVSCPPAVFPAPRFSTAACASANL